MTRKDIVTLLTGLADSLDQEKLVQLAHNLPTADLADAFEELTTHEALTLLRLLPVAARADLFAYFSHDLQDALLELMPRPVRVELFEYLPADDRVDIYNRMSDEERERLLPALDKAEREDILKLASYPEATVGSVTTSDYVAIRADMTVGSALEQVRTQAPDKETIYTVYVVDTARRLVGAISLRELFLAERAARVIDLMHTDLVFAKAEWPREEASRLISRYGLLAVPVINGGDKLIGIVTVDDAMDVSQEEATEDFHKGGGTLALKDLSVRDASVWTLFRKRAFWLVLLVFGNLFSGAGIAYFEDTIAAYIALVFFLPLLVDSGGNAGSQAATLMVRALATGDVVMRDWVKMLGREFGVAALLGVTMAVAVSGIGLFRGGPEIALVVSLSMVIIVVVGSLIGMSLPFLLSRFKLDPATASAPLITSIADATGVIIYLSLAVAILGAPPITG